MPIPTTTPEAIRTSIIAAIRAMTPTVRPGYLWRHVPSNDVLEVGHVRTFAIVHSPATKTEGGCYGADGIEYDYTMTIVVGYLGMPIDDASEMIWKDGRDLELLIQPFPNGGAGSINGLLGFGGESLQIEMRDGQDERGSLIAEYSIPVHFKAAQN